VVKVIKVVNQLSGKGGESGMPSFYVKDVPEALLFELQRLKAKLKCRTWLDFLVKAAVILEKSTTKN